MTHTIMDSARNDWLPDYSHYRKTNIVFKNNNTIPILSVSLLDMILSPIILLCFFRDWHYDFNKEHLNTDPFFLLILCIAR